MSVLTDEDEDGDEVVDVDEDDDDDDDEEEDGEDDDEEEVGLSYLEKDNLEVSQLCFWDKIQTPRPTEAGVCGA